MKKENKGITHLEYETGTILKVKKQRKAIG